MLFVVRSNNAWLTKFFAGIDVLQLGNDEWFQATYDCTVIEMYRLDRMIAILYF